MVRVVYCAPLFIPLEVLATLAFHLTCTWQDPSHDFGFLHRLDVPSSGLVLAAKTYEAGRHQGMSKAHASHAVRTFASSCASQSSFFHKTSSKDA